MTDWYLAGYERRGMPVAGSASVAATTFNPSNTSSHITLSGGNLVATSIAGATTAGTNVLSIASHTSGKYYAEFTLTTKVGGAEHEGIGIAISTYIADTGFLGAANTMAVYDDGHVFRNGADFGALSTTFVQGDVVSMALDIGNLLIWFRTNGGNWNNNVAADPATGANGITVSPLSAPFIAGVEGDTSGDVWTANFGATSYAQSVPSGFTNW